MFRHLTLLAAGLLAVQASGCRCQRTTLTSKVEPRVGPCDGAPAPATPSSVEEAEGLEDAGTQARRDGRLADAELALTRCVALSPSRPGCFKRLGSMLARREAVPEAYTCYRRYLELADPGEPDVAKVRDLIDLYEAGHPLVEPPKFVTEWKAQTREELVKTVRAGLPAGASVELGVDDEVLIDSSQTLRFQIADQAVVQDGRVVADEIRLIGRRPGTTTAAQHFVDGGSATVVLMVVDTPDCLKRAWLETLDVTAPLSATTLAHAKSCRACRRRLVARLIRRAGYAGPSVGRELVRRALDLGPDADQVARARLVTFDQGQ